MRKNVQNNLKDKRCQAKVEFENLIENVCSAGFYGSASVTINVQDGHIQTTRVAVDRMIR